MKTNFMAKIVLSLHAICLTNYASAPSVEEKIDQVNYICLKEHWQNMWCKKVYTHMLWTNIDDICNVSVTAELPYKLKTIPLMLGCGYGQELTHFLWVTSFTIIECNIMSQKRHYNAGDCWNKLKESLDGGVLTILKLLSTFDQIRSLDRRIAHSPFYDTLSMIHRFFNDFGPSVQYTIEENLWIIQHITEFATTLEKYLKDHCYPERQVLTRDKLLNEFGDGSIINVLYQNTIDIYYNFFINKLNSYTEFINQHLFKLGYRTTEPGGHSVRFVMPDRSG